MTFKAEHPFHPVIYVRGFAATRGEIEETVADPYMGFNIGSTKTRKLWTGEIRRYYFESPLVRLMGDHGYKDVFVDGDDLVAAEHNNQPVPYRSIVIYRYYDEASEDFGEGHTPPIEHFATGLSRLILRLRDKVCANRANAVTPEAFRVHLVAHSMGGLVCRAFLQNPALGEDEARRAVDKLFTYATPHNGIDMRIVRNVPGWLSFGDVNNFNRSRMAGYLNLPDKDDVSYVQGFPADRVFNLVGTNPQDYGAAAGLSAWGAGPASDGLVRIKNATTHGKDSRGRAVTSPRAFVCRSHSGHYGIVNSEEGYQNLTRFLFGDLRVDGILDIDSITLPAEVERAREQGHKVRASYQFETMVSVRGGHWQMTRRSLQENSAIFRSFDELFPEHESGREAERSRSPHLFSSFMAVRHSVKASGSVSLACELKVLVPDYEIDGVLFMKRHYEGGYILHRFILVEAFPDRKAAGGWRIKYGDQHKNPGSAGRKAATRLLSANEPGAGLTFSIPLVQKSRPGFNGALRIEARPWS